MHWLLNFSTAGAGKPEGVLVRGVLADTEGKPRRISGPGRVTRSLGIDKRLDGKDATRSKELWLEDRGVRIAASRVRREPRVGVDYAGPYWAARPWRYSISAEQALTSAESRADRSASVRRQVRAAPRGRQHM